MDDNRSQDSLSDIDGGDDVIKSAYGWNFPDCDDSEVQGISSKLQNEDFGLLDASLASEQEEEAELQEGLWESMPEEILWNILMRLPVTSQCRLRCVSIEWKNLLSPSSFLSGQLDRGVESRAVCTMMTDRISSDSWFFSHAEDKWFRLPFRPESCLDGEWRLQESDGGLLCYKSFVGGRKWLLVCNPISGAYQIVPPCAADINTCFRFVKLVVNKISNSFKIVYMSNRDTAVFDSKTQNWNMFPGPGLDVKENEFVCRNVIYLQREQFGCYRAFDMESGQWSTIELNLPCYAEKYRIVAGKDHAMFVQFYPKKLDPIRIWMSMDTEDAPSSLLSRWEKVAVEVPNGLTPLVDQIQEIQGCWSHKRELFCFGTVWTQHWLIYTFATKTWRVMPCKGKLRSCPGERHPRMFKWLHWEPCLDRHVEPVEFDAGIYLELLAAHRREMVWHAYDGYTGSENGDDSNRSDDSGSNPSDESDDGDNLAGIDHNWLQAPHHYRHF